MSHTETKKTLPGDAPGKIVRFPSLEQIPNDRPTLIRLADVKMLPIQFVDKPFFQANAFHLLVGKKNAGKGTFLSAVAARVTRGELGEKCNVIWVVAGEDSLAIDVHPRITAAGGDATRVYCCEGVIPKLPHDVSLLREWIAQIGDVGFVVLDPISGMLGDGKNSNADTDVRPAISPLNNLADETGCFFVGVRHLKKDVAQGALESVLGSVDWVNVPRAVLAMAMDDEAEDIRHVQVVAGNRLPRGSASRSLRIVGVDIVPGGEPVTKAEFLDGEGKDVDKLLVGQSASETKTTQAQIALLDKLDQALGPLVASEWTEEVISETRISAATVRNAKTQLKEEKLIDWIPKKNEAGKVVEWRVRRTDVTRPRELRPAGAKPGRISFVVCPTCNQPECYCGCQKAA